MVYGGPVQNSSTVALLSAAVKFGVVFVWNAPLQEAGLCSPHTEAAVGIAVFGLAARGKRGDRSCQLLHIGLI